MDSEEEARDYDAMDHREVNARFAGDFEEAARHAGLPAAGRLLDVGTGTALIPIEIATLLPGLRITAIDLAEEMLVLGRKNVAAAGLADRITLQRIDAKDLAGPSASFDAVVSNSIVHHIPQPLDVFREMARATRKGGVLFVRDLLRPDSKAELDRLVSQYAGDANDRQRQLFADSLHAALTLEEMANLLESIGLPRGAVRQTSDRHWTVSCVI
ncbi:MAG TPA: class I SAM-dependent methyltransferase [Caulifigura sp.]|nr:class I SAM-dependent methyltransferase [Caulifigura sp.]